MPVNYDFLEAALLLASIWCKKDIKQWLAELPFDVDMLNDVVRTLLAHYEMLRTFDEKREMPAILARAPRPNAASSVSALVPYVFLMSHKYCPYSYTGNWLIALTTLLYCFALFVIHTSIHVCHNSILCLLCV